MKTYTFKIKNTTNNTFNTPKGIEPDYSKMLDNIIISNIKKNNSYLNNYKYNDEIDFVNILLNNKKNKLNDFEKAANYLASLKKNHTPKFGKFELNKTYHLIDGTPICFYDDEIQIGADLFSYDELDTIDFINSATPKLKNTIISIYIKINL